MPTIGSRRDRTMLILGVVFIATLILLSLAVVGLMRVIELTRTAIETARANVRRCLDELPNLDDDDIADLAKWQEECADEIPDLRTILNQLGTDRVPRED